NPSLRYLTFDTAEWAQMATLTRVFVPDPGATTLEHKFTGLNAVYWTLAIEVQFYVVVAAAVLTRRWFYSALAVVTLASLPFALNLESYLLGLFLPYWPLFAVGGIVYGLVESGRTIDRAAGRGARVAGLAVTAVAVMAL